VRFFALAAVLAFSAARAAGAQLPPNEDWRTIQTQHFRIHFTPALEQEARRAAVNAERAYTALSTELVPPRGTIDLVVSDNVDYVNGYATPFPSNRIVVFAHPPTDQSGLRSYDDWNSLVITHELTHIFHLDRSRGIWRFGQAIFGRNPLLFPNAYQPSWVVEGLAVYFESRLTGYGRLESSEHSMVARAAALANRVPSLQELSPGTSRFPGGEVVYIYGSLLFDYLSRIRGPASIRDFVERGSRTPFPFILTATSRGAFGMSFQTAWRQWRDSLAREMKIPHEVMPGWREITGAGHLALFPRWLSDTSLIYAGNKEREVPAAYEVSLSGKENRLGRRNGVSPNVRMPDGSVLFAQPEFLGPYHIRNDLYLERNGTETRLTNGARLNSPDARADGEIVAVQDVPATTRLVRVSRDGRTIAALTPTDLDGQWSDPRWSPDGTRIAAVMQSRGRSEIVILDSAGKRVDSFGATHAINSAPSWSSDGRRIYFSSERSGLPQIYVADVSTFSPSISRLTDAGTGVFSPEASPDRGKLAAVVFSADGYHIGIAPLNDSLRLTPADSLRTSPRAGCTTCLNLVSGLPPLGTADTTARSRPYSPWLSLLPRYWLPVFESTTDDGSSFGAVTNGYDIVGRHGYTLEVLRNFDFHENSAWLWYRYGGLGLPLIDLYAAHSFSHGSIFDDANPVGPPLGTISERSRIASLQMTFVRPRFRNYTIASFGTELESVDYSTDPETLLPRLPGFYNTSHSFPALIASAGWSNARRPSLSISPEDGVTARLSGRQRWQRGSSGSSTRSAIGVTSAYKSVDLPGFAHHVIAFRAAGGITDDRSADLFSAGGVSGNLIEVFPGVQLGEQRRTFGVRGYPVSAEQGIRAYTGTIEYRAPLMAPSRGFRFIPVFVDKVSVSAFSEFGRAFCPAGVDTTNGVCRPADVRNPMMRSAGLELNIDAGVQLDFQARLRLGLAFPLANRQELGASRAQAYATFGASF
jgi:hypothetical protein